MRHRVRISQTLADRLGPDAMAIINADLRRRADRIRREAAAGARRRPVEPCRCGDDDTDGCMNAELGYPWCRPCREHHRAPECAIDSDGRALNPYTGQPWDEDWWRAEAGGPICPTCGHAQTDHDERDGCGACAMGMRVCRWWPT